MFPIKRRLNSEIRLTNWEQLLPKCESADDMCQTLTVKFDERCIPSKVVIIKRPHKPCPKQKLKNNIMKYKKQHNRVNSLQKYYNNLNNHFKSQ